MRATDGGRDRPRTTVRTTALLLAVLATTAMVVPFVGLGAAQVGPPVAACDVNEPFPEPGEDVTLDASASQDAESYRYDVEDSTTTTTLTVGGGAAPAPDVSGDGNPARDLDGDGLFEDVTGDGRLNVIDVAVLLDMT